MNRKYQYILFDLDGTLTDSGMGIVNSVAYSLQKKGIDVEDKEELLKFVGPPLIESYRRYYGYSMEEAVEMVDIYREYYGTKGLYENSVYEGMEEVLKVLKERGKVLIIATSKPEEYARQIVEHYGLSKYFIYVAGSNMDETRTKKAEVIAYALESCNIQNMNEVVMIGDRKHDVLGAKAMGVDSIGVLYGYGSREELEAAGADRIVESAEDLIRILE
ncbi:MAG: HAD family hydrolase [Candidatus Fimousia sp.]|uniref:HAD family hydrolase n=1 Tax=Anaerostipes sp. 992a TaxID=1261637 RepID=UPI0009527268|nr:HAD family hydrolase [Anaerostipes sp. 992a]OLR66063.1 phosphoglycolate phosphatase [Anaerostipes sp. 992a]